MAVRKGDKKVRNDYENSIEIARCLSSGAYKSVYIPDTENARDNLRMRDEHNTAL